MFIVFVRECVVVGWWLLLLGSLYVGLHVPSMRSLLRMHEVFGFKPKVMSSVGHMPWGGCAGVTCRGVAVTDVALTVGSGFDRGKTCACVLRGPLCV